MAFKRSTFVRARSAAGLSVFLLPLMMGAEQADSGCGLLQGTVNSPVHATTTVVGRADGTVEVDLAITSTEQDDEQFVTTATNAELRVPDGTIIPLTPAEPGHYRASSDEHPGLIYDASGTNYRVSFDLDDAEVAGDAAGEEFIAVVAAPDADVTFEISKEPAFAGDTAEITWSPGSLKGLLEIRDDSGTIIYTTFDWSHPEFDGSKWGSLIRGGSETLAVDVFSDPGSYTVSFCAVESQEGFDEEVSSGLGILSGFMAGKCVDDIGLDVAE